MGGCEWLTVCKGVRSGNDGLQEVLTDPFGIDDERLGLEMFWCNFVG